mgnify:CR=1 FL=1
MLFSELAKRVAEKYPEVKTAFPMDCELSNVELYDPNGAIPPADTLGIYTARQISEDMTLPLCFVCAGTPDQTAHDKIAYSDSNYIIIPQVSAVDVVYYIMSLFGDSFKQQKLYSNLIYMLLNGADLTSVFCEFSKGTGSQMLAIDISGKVLAYSKPFRVNHPHWIHSIEVGYLDNYLIEYILSYRVKHKMDMSPNTFVLFCNRLQMYIKVIRVIADNEIIGYVFMGNYTGEFPWFSDKLMHLLAKNLHSTLLGSRSYSTYRFNMHQSVLSDIIEGASEGAGLGHDFLRHIDRCRLLVHLVDVSGSEGRDPVEDFEAINTELRAYSDVLGSRMQIVAANKCDLLGDDRTNIDRLRAHVEAQGYEFFEMSAAAHTGTRELVQACAAKLAEIPPVPPYEADYVPPEPEVGTSDELQIRHFDDLWVVEGPWLQRLMANINFSDYESRMYFDKVLRQSGLFDQLEQMGIQDGDIVSMYDLEFEYQR